MASIEELQKDFEHLIKEERLTHSYIFFGPRSVYDDVDHKHTFSKALATYIETNSWEKSDKPLLDVRVIDAHASSGIDTVREANQFVWQKPIASPRRTVIIQNASALTLPAQQAILKTAEEPPPHGLIILIIQDPTAIIPALASRFQKIFFSHTQRASSRKRLTDSSKLFLASGAKERSDILKSIIDEPVAIDQFVSDILAILYRDRMTYWQVMRDLLDRYRLIQTYNVNKRLQLESALLALPKM